MAKLFISYSHRNEKALERLHTHLAMLKRDGLVETWFDRRITVGQNIDRAVSSALDESEIFIALVSPEFLNSNYCYETEMQTALARHDEGTIIVVPVIVEACDWKSSPLVKLKAVPKDGNPISLWKNQDVAYLDVVTEIRRLFPLKANTRFEPASSPDTADRGRAARRYRIRKEFDTIDRAEFAAAAFAEIQTFFQQSIDELNRIGDPIRARFEKMSEGAFTCTVLNKSSRNNQAHITVHLQGERGFGDISYSFAHRGASNTSNGHIGVGSDEYEQFLILNTFMGSSDRKRFSAEEAAEQIWREFTAQAGIDHD